MHCSLAATGFVWFSRCVVFFVEDADLTQALEKSYQRVLHRFGLANLFAHWHCYTTDRDATQQACAAIRKFAEC
jgi:hypothetical protein